MQVASGRVLIAALLGAGRQRPVRVGSGGVSCDSRAAFAGQARFPVADWKKQAVDAVIVLGDAACARDVATELSRARLASVVACGLECAEARGKVPLLDAALSTGSFPDAPWVRGRPFYEALGRDAAALARAAVAGFPDQRVMDQAKVDELHERARRALETADQELWTSEARGFGKDLAIERKLGVVDGSVQPGLKGGE